jgi:hypothetical protein
MGERVCEHVLVVVVCGIHASSGDESTGEREMWSSSCDGRGSQSVDSDEKK